MFNDKMMNTNMNAFYYGRNVKAQNTLSEDGFTDGMVNYLEEMSSSKAGRTGRKTSFFGSLFRKAGRKTPAYQG